MGCTSSKAVGGLGAPPQDVARAAPHNVKSNAIVVQPSAVSTAGTTGRSGGGSGGSLSFAGGSNSSMQRVPEQTQPAAPTQQAAQSGKSLSSRALQVATMMKNSDARGSARSLAPHSARADHVDSTASPAEGAEGGSGKAAVAVTMRSASGRVLTSRAGPSSTTTAPGNAEGDAGSSTSGAHRGFNASHATMKQDSVVSIAAISVTASLPATTTADGNVRISVCSDGTPNSPTNGQLTSQSAAPSMQHASPGRGAASATTPPHLVVETSPPAAAGGGLSAGGTAGTWAQTPSPVSPSRAVPALLLNSTTVAGGQAATEGDAILGLRAVTAAGSVSTIRASPHTAHAGHMTPLTATSDASAVSGVPQSSLGAASVGSSRHLVQSGSFSSATSTSLARQATQPQNRSLYLTPRDRGLMSGRASQEQLVMGAMQTRRAALDAASQSIIKRGRRLEIAGEVAVQDTVSELMSAIKAHAIQSPNNTNWKSIAGSSVPVVEKSAEDREFLVEALTQHFLFSGMDEEEMHVVVDSMSRHTFAPGTLLTQRGDASQCCYVLQQGSAEIVDAPAVAVRGAGAGAVPSSHVEPPGMVGELALLYDSKYETSVQATRECVAWSLHRHTFRLIVLSSAVKQFEDAKRFLRGVALLAPLDASQISRLAEASQRVSFMDGARIINQGDAGDIFYLIMRGRVRVMKRIPPVTVASAGSGKELRSAAGSTRSVTSLVASNAAGSARILAISSSAGKLGASSSAAAAGGSTHRVPSASALDGGALQTASDTSALSGDEAVQQARLLGSIPLSGAAMHAGESSRVAAHDGESKGVPARAATKKLQERNMVGDLLLPDVTPVDETYIDKPSIVLSPQTRKQFGRWSQISCVSDLAAGGVLREGSHDEDSEDEASHHSAHAAGENEEVELMQMEVGSWFGEQALLNDAPRAASVLADGPVTCLALTRDLFFLQLGSLAEVLRAQHTQREQIERSVVAMRSFHSPIAEVSETADSAAAAASASSVSPRLGGDTPTASLPPLASARGMQRNLTFTERQMQIFLVPAPGARSETETGLSPVTSTELARSSSAARLAVAAAAAASAEPASVLTSPSITAPHPDSGRVASPRSSAFPVTSSTGIMSPTSARANTVQQGLGGPRVSTGALALPPIHRPASGLVRHAPAVSCTNVLANIASTESANTPSPAAVRHVTTSGVASPPLPPTAAPATNTSGAAAAAAGGASAAHGKPHAIPVHAAAAPAATEEGQQGQSSGAHASSATSSQTAGAQVPTSPAASAVPHHRSASAHGAGASTTSTAAASMPMRHHGDASSGGHASASSARHAEGVASASGSNLQLTDLDFMAVLGEGAYGLVRLVRDRTSGEVFALKQMQKARIVAMKQQRNVINERNILSKLHHPFIIRFVKTFRDRDCLFLLTEYCPGGDFFGALIRVGGVLTTSQSRWYAAVVTSVLDYVHSKGIVYRDLKPENLLLDKDGFLKVCDFGFAKAIVDRTYTLCGTPEYLAPELVSGRGHGKGVDWWALGILIYEMLMGYSPFADHAGNDQRVIYSNIMKNDLRFPSSFRDATTKDLIRKLLMFNPTERLGCLAGAAADVRAHAFFDRVDWVALLKKAVPPPIRPEVHSATDTSNFDDIDADLRIQRYDGGSGDAWDAAF